MGFYNVVGFQFRFFSMFCCVFIFDKRNPVSNNTPALFCDAERNVILHVDESFGGSIAVTGPGAVAGAAK